MSEKLGPLTYGKKEQSIYLGVEYAEEKNYSEETAKIIDEEVRTLIETNHARAREILEKNRKTLDALAALLEKKEVISGEEVKRIVDDTAVYFLSDKK